MAEPDYYTSPPRVVAEMGSPSPTPQMQTNPSKFSSHFLFRGLFIAIFIALLPLFPSQAPEFINQTILTRSWELLHLLFVGIAVSYGLFSRRNIESEKENQLKIDTAQSYVARILEGSSVFDEDQVESPSGLDDSKIQTWNSQYFRGEPRVMVAKERSDLGTRRRISRTSSSEKPLLLPVRSLKSRVSDEGEVDLMNGVEGIEGSGDGSGLDSEGSSQSPRRNGVREIGEMKESVVLPSPIPWRSRSGRMEFNNERGPGIPRSYSLPRSAVTDEFGRFESPPPNSPIHWSPHPNSSPSPSPKKLSPSPSLSPEMRGKIGEDLGKKKGVHKRPPPPPPPLPPPPICSKSLPKEMNPKLDGGAFSMDMGRSFKNEVRNLSRSRSSSREDLPNSKDMDIDSWRLETRNKNRPEVRKSVRTIRGGEYAMEAKKGGDEVEMNGGRRPKEVDAVGAEKTGTRTASNQSSTSIEKQARSVRFSPPKIQNKESAQKFFVGPEDSDGDELHESSDGEVSARASVVDTGPDGNEVDKKADEFIAKFREQIRLQRIESIKRSSGQRSGAKPR
eukprot:TRINITY_DN16880_c0_g1_i1.p1 TRINITY_DN16880_c0_g1~~TRINITY_DN16880_c0_g1_i1.p1  ORF type:complete len:561 (+),score=136.45 TRINITY_DN16880_c0_g1_i1:3203-4885(+)